MEQRPPILDKGRIIFCVLLVILVEIGEVILHKFSLPTWPAFACMILYFLAHMDPKQIPHVIIGSFFGILNLILIGMFVKAFAATFGPYPAQLVYIGIFVAAIVLLKDHIPWVFNTNAFMVLVIAAVAASAPPAPAPVQWMAVELVGGTILVLGVYAIQKIVAAVTGPQQHSDH